jgi:hypothetical protein
MLLLELETLQRLQLIGLGEVRVCDCKRWTAPCRAPALDARGDVVAFSSRRPLDGGDRANDFDLFMATGALRQAARQKFNGSCPAANS